MKHSLFIAKHIVMILIIMATVITSCKKYLEPASVSTFSPDLAFNSVPYAKSAVLGAYSMLSGDYGYGIRLSMYYPYDSDEMMGQSGNTTDGERRDISRYNLTAGNAQLAPVFNQSYKGVENANNCIKYIPLMPKYTSGNSQEQGELHRLYGEALTLRAQFYFELIRNWGDLPAQFIPSTDIPNLFLPKTDRDTIYNHLLADLRTAEDLVPWRTEVGKVGDSPDERITKGTVKALRARIALFRGGYSLRRGSNQMERRSDYKTYYQIAYDECKDLVARRDEHTLNPSYRSVWKDYVCARSGNEPNGELLFQVAMGGASGQDSKLGTYNGTKFGSSGLGALTIMPTYFYMFDSTDVRRDVIAAPYETNTDGATRKGHTITSIQDGKWRRDWWSNPVDPTSTTANQGLNWVIIRFSDVMLMCAEADNELNGSPSAQSIALVKEVSQRAHGGDAALVPDIPADHDGFFRFLVRERMLEFGAEGIRKYDLIRWNLLATAITETRANLGNLGTATPLAITPPSYMAPPPWYCLGSNLPKTMYYYTNTTADDSKIWANSYYHPAPAAAPAGTAKVNWVGASTINTTFTTIFAYAFKANHNELLPLATATLTANSALTQDYGY